MGLPRASGVLTHPTSFPGPHGIGDLGEASFRFIDWLVLAGQRVWQVLPLCPTGFGNSPYAAPSAFAGNPLLVSLTWLAGDGLLAPTDLDSAPSFPDYEVMFDEVAPFKQAVLRRAFDRFRAGAASHQRGDFETFCGAEAYWLDDYALYMALKDEHGGARWTDWETDVKLRQPEAVNRWRNQLANEIRFYQFVQFQFRRQWAELKQYANEREIRILGDVPIFVAHDSADVWANQTLFRLDDTGLPLVVAGVPPDAFSDSGQRWGNPLFNWRALAATDYRWWVDRIRATLAVVDLIRIDHFRGFAAAWAVPASDETAANGRWERGPGVEIFHAIERQTGDVSFVIEDLGLITPDVEALREELGFPGMKILQFAFGEGPENPYLPHNVQPNSVMYSGTHDNQTTVGWYQSRSERERRAIQRYIGKDGSDIAWDLIRLALSSVSDTVIVPLQDVMRLGDEARMNTPGRPSGNWAWRYPAHQLNPGLAAGLGELTWAYGRRGMSKPEGHDPFDYTVPDATHPLHETPADG